MYDQLTGELRYDVRLDATRAADEIRLVALHRGKQDGMGPIIARVLEAAVARANGIVSLGHLEREALRAGGLYLRAYTRAQPTGGAPIRLTLPQS